MQPQGTSNIADASQTMLPQLPPIEGALPIDDADSALEQPSMPGRMSRQTLLQQHQSRLGPPTSPSMGDNATLGSSLDHTTTEMDLDDASGTTPSMPVPPLAQRVRPSRRFLSLSLAYVSPIVLETNIDPGVASGALAGMQADTRPAVGPAQSSRSSNLVPAIGNDAAEQTDDAQADESYNEGPNECPWLGEKPARTLRNRGLLGFITSDEAAMRCPKLVRNVPRMRKRSHRKKEHGLRNSREPTCTAASQANRRRPQRMPSPKSVARKAPSTNFTTWFAGSIRVIS
ncbi:hypothetical protein TARUN_9719 [Trichoderma arundinaceum]|uniref:Uncharacterized protein n=1 Tax=Trichoderma arundinaceum TaxID=490622 RepID=A0A395N8U1_TRIAR|nr:hypothetical protein TARUN_9719 [Trichoderma arundinaceum]